MPLQLLAEICVCLQDRLAMVSNPSSVPCQKHPTQALVQKCGRSGGDAPVSVCASLYLMAAKQVHLCFLSSKGRCAPEVGTHFSCLPCCFLAPLLPALLPGCLDILCLLPLLAQPGASCLEDLFHGTCQLCSPGFRLAQVLGEAWSLSLRRSCPYRGQSYCNE